MSFLDNVVLPNGQKVAPSTPTQPTTSSSFLNSVVMPSTQTHDTTTLAAQATQATQQSTQANSFFGTLKNTVTGLWGASGIPQAAQSAFQQGVEGMNTILNPKGGTPAQGAEGALNVGAGIAGTIFSPLAPVTNLISKAIDFAGNKLADTPYLQGYGKDTLKTPIDPQTDTPTRELTALQNLGGIAMGILGAKAGEIKAGDIPPAKMAELTQHPDVVAAVQKVVEAQHEPASSAISYIDKNDQKVFTKLTPDELSSLKDEVKNIPQASDGASQIHLDPLNDKLTSAAKEVSREDFIAGHPQAAEVFKNASGTAQESATAPSVPKTTEAPTGASKGLQTEPGVSKIGKSIEVKAVEANLTRGFDKTAGYDTITIKDQAGRATNLVNSSIDDTRAIIRGDKPLPEGLKGTALITAAEEHLKAHPDPELAYELANSPLTSATSEAAQEMRLMAERVPDSITAKFKEIKAAREAALEKRGGAKKAVKQATNEIRKEITKTASKRPTWEEFTKQLTCNV